MILHSLLHACTSSPPPLTGAVSADEKHKCKPEDQVLVGFVYSLLYVGIHVHVHVYSYTVAQHVQMLLVLFTVCWLACRWRPECAQRTGRSSGYWQRSSPTTPTTTATWWMTLTRRGTTRRGLFGRAYCHIHVHVHVHVVIIRTCTCAYFNHGNMQCTMHSWWDFWYLPAGVIT